MRRRRRSRGGCAGVQGRRSGRQKRSTGWGACAAGCGDPGTRLGAGAAAGAGARLGFGDDCRLWGLSEPGRRGLGAGPGWGAGAGLRRACGDGGRDPGSAGAGVRWAAARDAGAATGLGAVCPGASCPKLGRTGTWPSQALAPTSAPPAPAQDLPAQFCGWYFLCPSPRLWLFIAWKVLSQPAFQRMLQRSRWEQLQGLEKCRGGCT